ncbi:hypothetical protein [Horticoccus sp. 23ND18S-11]|uniref:hypothetical protein n=1 Tax=Horticoccus sp. 23ND18S-11 TaxID=3391832 RepID=UPI0039C94D7D
MFRPLIFALLAASLLANVWFLTRPQPADAPNNRATAARLSPLVPTTAPAPASEPLALLRPGGEPLTTADMATLRTRLESLGLPPEIVRAVLAMTIHRSFQKRREAILRLPGPDEYWRNQGQRADPADQIALRELDREQRRLLRESSADFEFDDAAERRQFGGLPGDTVARLKRIFADYSDLEEQLYADGSDRGSSENRNRAALLAKEKRADIERLLSPDELLDYDLRNHPAAHRLRGAIGQFAATEAEFVALFPAFRAALEAAGGNETRTRTNVAEARRTREALESQLDTELQRVLGSQRFAELKDANNHLLQETRAFTASLNLPPQATTEVISVQQEFSPKLNALDRDRDLTANERDARAYALAKDARDRLIRVLGTENFEAYKRRGGAWLGSALNRAPPSTPVP